MAHQPSGEVGATPSHLILHVADTDSSIAFYRTMFDATVDDDHRFTSKSLDRIFKRDGVEVRTTFINAAGYRLHTIETLDVRRQPTQSENRALTETGLNGISFKVQGLDGYHRSAVDGGFSPTEIYTFDHDTIDHIARMFFVNDPDGVRCELVEYLPRP